MDIFLLLLSYICYKFLMTDKRRRIARFFLFLGFLTGCPALMAQVRVWQGTLTLPTYEEGPPNPNPPFDQYSTRINYPYTLRDRLTDKKEKHVWRAVFLENKYLKCAILPDLGGHVYTCMDKLSGQPMFYANPSIKKADIGYRGSWATFGIEFNFPVSHNWVTLSPVDYAYASHPDGSASVYVGNIDRVYGMQWNVEIVLRPGSTVLELHVRLNNRSDVRHRFYWWSNAAVQVWNDSHVTYPMRFTATHGFTGVDTWPVNSRGVNLSLLKNQIYGHVSLFMYGSSEKFMGIWHPHTDTGVVHYASYEALPGKKIWSWGASADGLDWRKTLSDNDSAYMEVQAGLFRNQETYAFLQPRQTIHFAEYWMPVRGLGGFVRANLAGVLNLSREGNSLKAAFNANRNYPGATVRILDGATVVFNEKTDLAPERIWRHRLAPADPAKKYTVEIFDADGQILMRHTEGKYNWTPKAAIKTGPQTHYVMPAPAQRSEDDWLQLGKDEELNGACLKALSNYKQALVRFPGSLGLEMSAGRLATDVLHYGEAVQFLEAVRSRQTWNAEAAYYLGIAYDGLGREREARLAFDAARRLPDFYAAASLRLAEIEARQGQFQIAEKNLEAALHADPGDPRIAEELVAVEQALGRTESARALASEWLVREPTDYFLRDELGDPDNAHLGAEVARVLNVAREYMRLGLYKRALGVLSRHYPSVPATQREPGESAPKADPLVAYYRGFCEEKLGRSPAQDYALAATLSTKYVFPAGAISDQVLRSALRVNPRDANAAYLLGTLEFSVGMTDDALARWQQALSLDPKIPALNADLGRAFLRVKSDPTAALAAFQRGSINDPANLENYFGLDQSLSLLHKPASERVAALERYPDRSQMPSGLVYELALNLAEAGQFDKAEALFQHRYLVRAEGETNVREVWIEVRLQHALALASRHRCDAALQIADHLQDPVSGLDFTQDGLAQFLDSARAEYLLGELDSGCVRTEPAKEHFRQAAVATDLREAAWAFMAAQKGKDFKESTWRFRLQRALAASETDETSLGSYDSAMIQRELGNEKAADADLREALLLPDSKMAYHLARLARSDRSH